MLVIKKVGKVPGIAGSYLKTIWGFPEKEVNPKERKVKKWTDPL